MEQSDEHVTLPEDGASEEEDELIQISRRVFIKGSGAIVIATGVAALAGCGSESGPATTTPIPTAQQYPDVADTDLLPPSTDGLHVFTPQEAETIEALTARIIPGDASDPGAREAGVVYFIDHMMTFHDGDDEATYRDGPHALEYEINPPANFDPAKDVPVSKDELPRYGYQSGMTPVEEYRAGLVAVDKYATAKFGQPFARLSEAQQDAILMDMSMGKATGFDKPSAESFFDTLRDHTILGMFSDPGYGGNRNFIGWNLIGYPGSQRGWTPTEMRTEGFRRPPQSLAQLMPEGHGQPAPSSVLNPVTGSSNHPKLP
jgi:gluconate 2-dehydrogenase gamma chain